MIGWQPIETAPETGEFLAERQSMGEWLRVVRHPLYPGDQSVVNPQTGLLWCPLRWMPVIPPITREEARHPPEPVATVRFYEMRHPEIVAYRGLPAGEYRLYAVPVPAF